MTDITVTRSDFVAENRAWLAGPHGTEPGTTPSVTLDLSKFSDIKFADLIKSGCVLGKVTATGLYGPYDNAASDGREVAKFLLFNTVSRKAGQTKVGNAGVVHAFVNESKLPYASGVGSLDSAGKADLTHLILV